MSKRTYDKGKSREKRIRISDDLLWGIHPVYEGLEREPERFSEIIIQKERHGDKVEDIIKSAKKKGVRLIFVDSLKIVGEGSGQARHQGVVARICETGLVSFEELVEKLKTRVAAGEKCRLMVLDSLQDPHNVGAIIRSALASGAAAVLVTRERSAPLGGTAAKSSAGAMAHIDICQVTNLVNALKELKKNGFWVFGAVKDAHAVSLFESDLTVPACLVVGSEGKGIRPLVKKECDVLISIPMKGSLDSLNSSVAAGVILFEAMRQNMS
ncbi:MAG: 23S rRNA (guanosine(2251)-2'-O)-methyltransferase RlmB [Desulfobacterales bacterium]|nr:MAG: 23S rRNA (guanosine(2251)-2'-O)-methyltransferase RlmB [Desulfobacterales bacterium]